MRNSIKIKLKRLSNQDDDNNRKLHAKPLMVKGVNKMEVINYSKYGEIGETAKLINDSIVKSGMTNQQLLDIEEEAKKQYAKSRFRQ